jgi:ribA/ribD-fused uncharacterized protein
MKRIQFYKMHEPYGEFSNFSPHPVELGGKAWKTAEHYFQAQKFAGTEHEEVVRLAHSPMVAARLGRSRQRSLRADWDTIKDGIMLDVLRAKFSQHPALKALLLGTGDALIVEHTTNDRYWGDGGNGKGRNRLGELLMELREELRKPQGS